MEYISVIDLSKVDTIQIDITGIIQTDITGTNQNVILFFEPQKWHNLNRYQWQKLIRYFHYDGFCAAE